MQQPDTLAHAKKVPLSPPTKKNKHLKKEVKSSKYDTRI